MFPVVRVSLVMRPTFLRLNRSQACFFIYHSRFVALHSMGHPALDLTNKTAVVMGGTSGIGLALAKGLVQAGANVVATGRRADLVKSAAEAIRSFGRASMAITSDVTDRGSI